METRPRVDGELGRQQLAGVGVIRCFENVPGGAVLDDPSQVHDRNPMRKRTHRVEVVGDEQGREVHLLLKGSYELDDLGADTDVEGGRRLVEDNEARPGGKCPRDADPLLLPGRQFVGRQPATDASRRTETSNSATRLSRSRRVRAPSKRSGSARSSRTRHRGLRARYGSWNTICMFRRVGRNSARSDR